MLIKKEFIQARMEPKDKKKIKELADKYHYGNMSETIRVAIGMYHAEYFE